MSQPTEDPELGPVIAILIFCSHDDRIPVDENGWGTTTDQAIALQCIDCGDLIPNPEAYR